jgi:hypothetical protein
MSLNISIPEPCNQNWNQMQPNEKGRYCDTCKLTVVDFTKMSNEEIKSYLLNKSYVCGRFDCTQIGTSHLNTLESLIVKSKNIKFLPLRFLAVAVASLLLLFYGCVGGRKTREERLPHKLMGAVAFPYDYDKNDSDTSKKNDSSKKHEHHF